MPETKEAVKDDRASKLEPLSEQYYKSRKQLALYSALLFAWEFIGIELPADPFPNVDVHIKSPQAVPWVLIALIAYFAYRTLVEWLQSDPERRALGISRLDVYVTMAIPTAALATFGVQKVLEIQIADRLAELNILVTVFVTLSSLAMGLLTGRLLKTYAVTGEVRSQPRVSLITWGLSTSIPVFYFLIMLLVANIAVAVFAVPETGLLLHLVLLVIPFSVGVGWTLLYRGGPADVSVVSRFMRLHIQGVPQKRRDENEEKE